MSIESTEAYGIYLKARRMLHYHKTFLDMFLHKFSNNKVQNL